jgi:hypothetical protein
MFVEERRGSVQANRLLSEGYTLIRNSVQSSTRNRYDAQWDKWKFFLTIFHAENTTGRTDEFLKLQSADGKLEHIIAFAAYLHVDCKFKKETVGNYLSAIKYYLISFGNDVAFFSNIAVTRILTGMHLTDVAKGVLPDQKKPFPLQMTRYLVDVLLTRNDMKHRVIRVGVLMAYFLLLRQSEYVYKSTEMNHAIRACDVEFMHVSGQVFWKSYEVALWKYADVESVKVSLPHCKNDPFRRGNQFWYEAHKAKQGEFDIVAEMFEWAQLANSLSDDVFTSFRNEDGEISRLTYYAITKKIRDTALAFHLNPKIFGTHSWRIGGATTLDAAKVPMESIQLQGRWKSVNMPMHYSKANRSEFNNARTVLANESWFTVKDLLYYAKN